MPTTILSIGQQAPTATTIQIGLSGFAAVALLSTFSAGVVKPRTITTTTRALAINGRGVNVGRIKPLIFAGPATTTTRDNKWLPSGLPLSNNEGAAAALPAVFSNQNTQSLR